MVILGPSSALGPRPSRRWFALARLIWLLRGALAATAPLLPGTAARAQGVTTSGLRGSVAAVSGARVEARVRVERVATGVAVEVRAPAGQFVVQGLEPGGPYAVTVRAVGFVPARREGLVLALGEMREVDFVLQPLAVRLDTVQVVAGDDPREHRDLAGGGTGTTITTTLLERLPTPSRDLFDFVRLVPQVSTKIGLPSAGVSGGGAGFRFNDFLVNGVSGRTLSGGVSPAFAGSRSAPLAALQELQVLLSPYDVRYGDFAGALVNAVTKSGTNELHGSAFVYARSDRLARRDSAVTYEKVQYGLSLGGPVVRDRVHFFVAPELEHFTYPAAGPYLGQPSSATPTVPVSAADLARFDAIMRRDGLAAGSAGPVQNGNPLHNLFARLDAATRSGRSRLVLWHNYGASDQRQLSRADSFALSSYQTTAHSRFRTTAAHVHTALGPDGAGHNELLLAYGAGNQRSVGAVDQPIVRVSLPSPAGGRATLNTGTPEFAQGRGFRAASLFVTDNLSMPIGASHILTLGAQADRFHMRRGAAPMTNGAWSFASLDALERGVADQYELRVDSVNADAPLHGGQYAAYAGDRWQATRRLSLTGGVRADVLALEDRAPHNQAVDSIFGRRTDRLPRRRVEWSPRLGFVWDLPGAEGQRVRGGVGVFAGRYPLAWAHSALTSYGVGAGVLRCSVLGPLDRFPPPFTPYDGVPPRACSGSAPVQVATNVNLLAEDLRMARTARASLAYERQLPWEITLTNEVLATRTLSDFVLRNLNLPEPVGTDPHGRVMYGVLLPSGARASTPARRSSFDEVIDLRNTSRGYSYQLTTRIESTRRGSLRGSASYTFSRTRDVQTPLRVNTTGTVLWASARPFAGRDDDPRTGISGNDIPHRVIVAGAYAAPWSRGRTELSLYYVGESGRPFTYIVRGDLNADGSAANDPVYVPRSAVDTNEVLFGGGPDSSLAQPRAFDAFVSRRACLRRQRGRIVSRNSCREPWLNTTMASLRQVVPLGGRAIEAQLDIFNLLDLLHAGWGLRREAVPVLLDHVGQTAGTVQTSRPIFRFDASRARWTTVPGESSFQLQLALRYRF